MTLSAVGLTSCFCILTYPNRIGYDDWGDWYKERGLYFAKSWDEAYRPLLEMADPAKSRIAGRCWLPTLVRGEHVHTSLILHHQMEKLVPGAFRLMANLIARREGAPVGIKAIRLLAALERELGG